MQHLENISAFLYVLQNAQLRCLHESALYSLYTVIKSLQK